MMDDFFFPGVPGPADPLAATGNLVLLLFKAMFIVAALLYLVFAGVVIRQVHIMKRTLITDFSPLVLVAGYAHFIITLVVLVFFLVIL